MYCLIHSQNNIRYFLSSSFYRHGNQSLESFSDLTEVIEVVLDKTGLTSESNVLNHLTLVPPK